MGLDVRPSMVHAEADNVADAGVALARLAGDLGALTGEGEFETDAMLGRVTAHLAEQWRTLSSNASTLAEAMHDSATSVEKTEATNTELAREFFRRAGGE